MQLLKMPTKDIPDITQNKTDKHSLEMTALLIKVRVNAECIWEIPEPDLLHTVPLLTKQRIHRGFTLSSAQKQLPTR